MENPRGSERALSRTRQFLILEFAGKTPDLRASPRPTADKYAKKFAFRQVVAV
jgi:hypothetical protein